MKFSIFFVLIALLVMIIPTALAATNSESEEILTVVPESPVDLLGVSNLPISL